MTRPWQIWLVFALCFAVALAATGWVTLTALRLDRAEQEARALATREESVRLALWRMDSALAPLIAQENARLYFAYTAFYPAERAYTSMYAPIGPGEVLMPSPLLTFESPYVVIHFQIGPDGELSSPQVPESNMRDLAELSYTTHEKIEAAAARLARLQAALDRGKLVAAFDKPQVPAANPTRSLPQGKGLERVRQVQSIRSQEEFQSRQVANSMNLTQQTPVQQIEVPESKAEDVLIRPIWDGELLLLVRRVEISNRRYLQGCQLDWPAMRQWLLGEIRDLLPQADLLPAPDGANGAGERMLAALPVRLTPGALPETASPDATPVRLPLIAAWLSVLLAVVAVAALLLGAVSLSERRGAFVSSVTHELRSPLTTFRMYAEMLAEGMVRDEAKQRQYLDTLRIEADRLSHLVENVLAYARLERGASRGSIRTMAVSELLGGIVPRLTDRAQQAGMQLVNEASEESSPIVVKTDASAVEQILFNLVDNACKYAARAEDKRVHLRVARSGRQVIIEVCDHGPGITKREAKKLFKPFRKSAREAAHSAPGVGLGLALSRRLARNIGGELSLRRTGDGGARFALEMPLAVRP